MIGLAHQYVRLVAALRMLLETLYALQYKWDTLRGMHLELLSAQVDVLKLAATYVKGCKTMVRQCFMQN